MKKRITQKFKKENLRLAFDKCLKNVDKSRAICGTSVSAGFIKGTESQWQVFVEIQEFDPALLKSNPKTGGLVKYLTSHCMSPFTNVQAKR